jgi:hypothetical protein
MNQTWRIALTALFAAAVAGFIMWLAMPEARAHDAPPSPGQPQGWTYPVACCSGYDCRPVAHGRDDGRVRIFETAEGYRFSTSKEVVVYTDSRLRESPDGEFHWCTVAGADDGRTICLFVPPRAF